MTILNRKCYISKSFHYLTVFSLMEKREDLSHTHFFWAEANECMSQLVQFKRDHKVVFCK